MTSLIARCGVASAHEQYVFGEDRCDEAVAQLAGIAPSVVTSHRPLLRTTERDPDAGTRILPFQHPDTGRYMNTLEGTRIELAPELIAALARKVDANRRHFPREDTLASAFDLPGLYVRLDCFITAVDDQWKRVAIAICEFDDQPAFVGSFRLAHPTAYAGFRRLASELAGLGRPLGLAEYDQDPSFATPDSYPHDDRHWLSDIDRHTLPEEVAAVVRARRWVPGSRRFLDRWTAASIFPGGMFRDYKGVLGVPRTVDDELGLGVLVHDHEVARLVIAAAHRERLGAVVAKGLFSARKEASMAIRPGSKVPASYYRLNQLKRLAYGRDDGNAYVQPLVLQPAFRPSTLQELAIRLHDRDRATVSQHRYRMPSGEVRSGAEVFAHLPAPGNERRFHGLFRLYFIYLPSENRCPHKHARFAGGLLQACTTPMAIHGSNGALTVWVGAMDARV